MLRGYVITSAHEQARAANVDSLIQQLPLVQKATAIYPAFDHVLLQKKFWLQVVLAQDVLFCLVS